ncbi:MarR family winged helix-turn-helix transcriptional regulator [Nocardiopsis aegyptia]|uniref:MarR family winged helix-turn-helix transcriptional regulator n=1 Tax=Nocardiopsis aegyptia TaxID=220378 RepID=UPI003670E5AF
MSSAEPFRRGTPQGPGQVLFEFVRHWSRRSNPSPNDSATAEQGRLVLVTEAVHSVARREPATVNAVADELGMDQSGASRLVKSAVAAGFLRMRASESDGRRRHVTVTPAGLTMLDQAHAWQETVFDRLAEGWSDRQRDDFQQAMLALLSRSHTIDP